MKFSDINISKFRYLILSLIAAFSFSSINSQATLACSYVAPLMKLYYHYHYSHKKMNKKLQKLIVNQYVKYIDPSKTLLIEEDVKEIKKLLNAYFVKIKKSKDNCNDLYTIEKTLLSRSLENENFVKAMLDKKYKLDRSVELNVDSKKRPFPKTVAEKNSLLAKYVHFQISNYLSADSDLKEAKKNLKHRYELFTKQAKDRSPSDVHVRFVNAFASSLDPHSHYFSQDSYEDFQIQMSLSLEGIGATLSSQDGYTVVEELVSGGAAAKQGELQPKDKIIAVAQIKEKKSFFSFKQKKETIIKKPVTVIDMELRDVVKLIRGKKGSKVRLTILRKEGSKTTKSNIVITRDKVDLKDEVAKLKWHKKTLNGKTLKLAEIELPSFYGDEKKNRLSSADIKKLLLEVKKEKADGLLFNLARNGGGLLNEAIKIGGLFIQLGAIVAAKDSGGRVQIQNDVDPSINYSGPMVVLTSRRSASASEILAGALKDYKRALIVGADHTFGKGSIQTVMPVPGNQGAVKITTGMFFIPGGHSTQHEGVSSHIEIPSLWNSEEIGERTLDASIPHESIKNFISKDAIPSQKSLRWTKIPKRVTKSLREQSKLRVSKSEKFKEILKEIAEAKENKGTIKISDIDDKSKKQNKKNKDKSRKEIIAESEAPQIEEALNVLADLVTQLK